MSEVSRPFPATASFRDPAGRLYAFEGRILRTVNASGREDLEAFLASATARAWLADGRLAGTRRVEEPERSELLAAAGIDLGADSLLLEHERIPFPSFPYEWSAEMLHAAGQLTLDLAQQSLADGLGLKDATPYNVLFRGPQAVFIDVLSVERRDPKDPTWLPYAQFVRTFLLPLLANRRFGLPLDQILITRRDGLEPEDVYRWANALQRLRPPFLTLVSLPTWLSRRHNQDDASIYERKLMDSAEKAQFILGSVLNGLRRKLRNAIPQGGKTSTWSDYMSANNNYTREHFAAKEKFVTEAFGEFHPRRVLDAGCNTGHFSALAARGGASVVGIDYDPVVVGETWRRARDEKLDILPLVVNLTRPTPGMGWLNREWGSFLDRARGSFDAVLMLALIHHMLVTERVPLGEILQLAADLTNDLLIVEFIEPSDSMFLRLTRGRGELHRDLSCEVFENHCREHFSVVRRQHLEGTHRWLYLLRKNR
jgi:SAM-dependent methyltransferase